MARDLGDIIRRRQDEIRGRPRNWRDDLSDWWAEFSFMDDVYWPVLAALMFLLIAAYLGLVILVLTGCISAQGSNPAANPSTINRVSAETSPPTWQFQIGLNCALHAMRRCKANERDARAAWKEWSKGGVTLFDVAKLVLTRRIARRGKRQAVA